MAIIKHIKSRNANYSDALEYLLFQHNEKTGKPVLDDSGRKILREEFYMDGLNCDPMSFDKECEKTNQFFHKNQKRGDIKSHHYIISFDPADTTECGLNGEKAQALCLEFARKNFPGYQALVVTHTDGHNGSGNIHTHIVINSVRKYAVERQNYMDKPHEQEAGYKHRSTNKLLNHLKQEVMDMCNQEGLHQVDLLSPASTKMTRGEYWTKAHGQDELDKVNEKIRAAGLKPTSTVFQTQKQFLRDAIDECSKISRSFDEFQSLLLDRFNISVIEKRGSYRYLHPDRDRRISAESLGANYGKDFLEQVFQNHENRKDLSHKSTHQSENATKADYHKDPFVIFYIKSELRLVTDLQTNVKAMQNQAYARKVKISNLQQMANTLIYIQDHGYDTREDLEKQTADIQAKMEEAHDQLSDLTSKMKTLNSQIHYTGQYFASKSVYIKVIAVLCDRSNELFAGFVRRADIINQCQVAIGSEGRFAGIRPGVHILHEHIHEHHKQCHIHFAVLLGFLNQLQIVTVYIAMLFGNGDFIPVSLGPDHLYFLAGTKLVDDLIIHACTGTHI